jgi:hypothetical protein
MEYFFSMMTGVIKTKIVHHLWLFIGGFDTAGAFRQTGKRIKKTG